jgi:hypothetical protein
MAEPMDVVPSVEATADKHDGPADSKPALTPPTSEDMDKREERMSSPLSELESDDDDEEIEPDHYYDGGKVPVFKPVRQAPSARKLCRNSFKHVGMVFWNTNYDTL